MPSSGDQRNNNKKKKGGNKKKKKESRGGGQAKEDDNYAPAEDEEAAVDNRYEPASGSWVTELEDAVKDAMEWFEREDHYQYDDDEVAKYGEEHAPFGGFIRHVRVCRAYATLRMWDELAIHVEKLVPLLSDVPDIEGAGGFVYYRKRFQSYQKRAKDELAVDSMLNHRGATATHKTNQDGKLNRDNQLFERHPDGSLKNEASFKNTFYDMAVTKGLVPDLFARQDSPYGNANMLQDAVLNGDVRLMEELVRLGSSLDRAFREETDERLRDSKIMVPTTASALLAACVVLAIADSTNPNWSPLKMGLPIRRPGVLDGIATCATLLVHLGADVDKKYVLQGNFNMVFYLRDLDNMTAFQIANMTNRSELVKAMVEHKTVSQTERAENLAYCRCGSRLPWKQCHATGIGQPPHYITKSDGRIHYRVSPMARCPCGIQPTTYYQCCWRDNGKPTYMDDRNGFHFGTYINAAPAAKERIKACMDKNDPTHAEFLKAYYQGKEDMKESAKKIKESQDHFLAVCAQWGPKSKISTWDRAVYAGCLERLIEPFYWTDVHWDLDKPELFRRMYEWNRVLEQYCDDTNLSGQERDRVMTLHTAHLLAPCGYVGCNEVEKELREFQRCSRCKKIAYCSRSCQKKDWGGSDGHKKVCKVAAAFEADGPASRK